MLQIRQEHGSAAEVLLCEAIVAADADKDKTLACAIRGLMPERRRSLGG